MAAPLKSSSKPKHSSRAEWIASLNASERQHFLSSLSDEEQAAAAYDWHFWARPSQVEPAHVGRIWLVLAGRGFGKTRAGAEWVRDRVAHGARRIALVAPTPADARDTMIRGESGLLNISPPWDMPEYSPSNRRLTWPNGAEALVFSGHEPDALRGPQHDTAWCDEIASWQYAKEAWDNLQMGLRIMGDLPPRVCVTTTPKPISLLRSLRDDPATTITGGSTYENYANLSSEFVQYVVKKYEGTSLGEQELHAVLLDEAPGALWQRKLIEETRISLEQMPDLVRIVVAIDPAVTATEESSETGIVACGVARNGHGYVLDDCSGRLSPDAWGRAAISAYHDRKADRIIGEENNGGTLVRQVIINTDPRVAYKSVHASQGKHTRAEPVAAKYEQRKVHHVGRFATLEDQMCTWTVGDKSPDRMDALVWALSELMLSETFLDAMPISMTRESPWRK